MEKQTLPGSKTAKKFRRAFQVLLTVGGHC